MFSGLKRLSGNKLAIASWDLAWPHLLSKLAYLYSVITDVSSTHSSPAEMIQDALLHPFDVLYGAKGKHGILPVYCEFSQQVGIITQIMIVIFCVELYCSRPYSSSCPLCYDME